MQRDTEDTSLDGDGESLRGPLAAAALGGLAGALVGAARVLASRRDTEADEPGEAEEHEDESEPRAEAESVDDAEASERHAEARSDDDRAEDEPDAEDEASPEPPEGEERERPGEPAKDGSRPGPAGDVRSIVERATDQLAALTGRAAESVLALERTDDGWLLRLETVELQRVPSSTDVLGAYEVELDRDGELRRYARVDRYVRSRSGDGAGS